MQTSGVNLLTNSRLMLEKIKTVEQQNDFASKLDKLTKEIDNAAEDIKLRQACQELESVFINILLTQMRSTIPKSGLLGNDNTEDIYQSMLDTERSKDLAKAGGIGLADALYRQLSPTQNGLVKSPSRTFIPD